MKRIARYAFVALMAASPTQGATVPQELGFDTDEPIAVNADSFSADLQGETGTYSGNVLVVQGAIRLRADEITVAAPGGQATRMEARGGIVVESPSGTATGALAIYDIPTQIIRLTGNVVLTNNANVMRGNALEVRIADGRATLTGGAATNGQDQGQGRVQGLFVPAEDDDNQ
jgi:lipopolysaccharide export system protein LptA